MDGTTLPIQFGRFKLMRRIGAGGMGEVFLAREELGNASRACVVKKVLPQLVANRVFVGRFLDEAKVVVRLSHPNIARVYSMGEVQGEYYLAMEYVQGKTVSRFMHRMRVRQEILPFGLVLLIGEQICKGLAYAHDETDVNGAALQLVHRDLSPANVCVSYQGEVKIIDFGAATSILKEEQTAPRVVIGNLTYMAPEQARKKIVDRRADVYATGVVLWELLAWKTLPQKGDPVERWRKAANPSWEAPSIHRPELPPEVDQVILKAVKKDPAERYASAAAMGEALAALRQRFAPGATIKMLAEILNEAFASEKRAEDDALKQVGANPMGPGAGVPIDWVATEKERAALVPPTVLAFEHRAISGPMALASAMVSDDVTELWVPRRREAKSGAVSESRVAFLESTGPVEDKLAKEIEPGDAEPEKEREGTASFDTAGRRRRIALGLGVFLGASAVGYLAIWLMLLRH